MTDQKDTISYGEYQKLSDEEKQNWETHFPDGKSGIATRKGTKMPEVKSTIPVGKMKQTVPNTAQDILNFINGKFDEKDTDAADAEAKGKTETTDKANQMSNSSKGKTETTDKANQMSNSSKGKTETTDKANQMSNSSKGKTDTTATDKSINPFQAGKEAADKAVEDYSILLDRVKQLKAKIDSISSKDRNTFSLIGDPDLDRELLKLSTDSEALAKELGIDIGSLSVTKRVSNKTPSRFSQIKRLEKINEELNKVTEEKLAAAKTIQQEAAKAIQQEAAKTKQQKTQVNYTKEEESLAAKKAREEAAKRKAESKPAPKAQKAETETEKAETKDPLKKTEELEQPQTPTDIKRFSNDLNRFVIQAYLNGDFGKKSSPNAIATMGFFILDKIGAALVNASEVARGMSPSAKSQWSTVLDKQTELLGKRITADWFLSLPKEKQEALIRSGVIAGTTAQTIYDTVDPNAVSRVEQKDILEISKLSQEQKGVAQSNVNALLARKSELQTLIAQLKSDQGWEVYAQAMNAVVGTAKGLSSLGVTDSSNSSSKKGFSDTISASVSTGKLASKFVSGSVSNSASWNNSSAEALSKSNSLNQDALALSRFNSGESYAKATREAKKAANEQLIKHLEGQIEIIDKCIDSWGKDLGL